MKYTFNIFLILILLNIVFSSDLAQDQDLAEQSDCQLLSGQYKGTNNVVTSNYSCSGLVDARVEASRRILEIEVNTSDWVCTDNTKLDDYHFKVVGFCQGLTIEADSTNGWEFTGNSINGIFLNAVDEYRGNYETSTLQLNQNDY